MVAEVEDSSEKVAISILFCIFDIYRIGFEFHILFTLRFLLATLIRLMKSQRFLWNFLNVSLISHLFRYLYSSFIKKKLSQVLKIISTNSFAF